MRSDGRQYFPTPRVAVRAIGHVRGAEDGAVHAERREDFIVKKVFERSAGKSFDQQPEEPVAAIAVAVLRAGLEVRALGLFEQAQHVVTAHLLLRATCFVLGSGRRTKHEGRFSR